MNEQSDIKIWDTFLYSGESTLLCHRIKFLSSYCDYFVIVESSYTFSGMRRNISDLEFRNRLIKEYPGKIKWVIIENFDESLTAWQREAWLRNQIKLGLQRIKTDDVILLSDVDEIPNQDFLKRTSEIIGEEFLVAKMKLHYYEIDLVSKENWFGTIATKWSENLDFQELRLKAISNWKLANSEIVENAGNHYSSLGNSKNLSQKIQSFSHTEFNVFPFNNSFFLNCLLFFGIKFDGSEVLGYAPEFNRSNDLLCTRQHRLDKLRKIVAIGLQPLVAYLFRVKVRESSSPDSL